MLANLAARADDQEFVRRRMRLASADFRARASRNTRPIPLPRGSGRKASNESSPSRRDSKAGFPATTNCSLGNAVLNALSMGVAITASPNGLGRRIRVAEAGGKAVSSENEPAQSIPGCRLLFQDLANLGGQGRNHFAGFAHDAIGGVTEDGGVGILVDRDDDLGGTHSRQVLDGPADSHGKIKLR